MKWIDIPPVWLLLALVMAWQISVLQPQTLVLSQPALDLLGGLLVWSVLVLMLGPLFIATLTQRFILPEEDRLRRKFRADFARYCAKTRRWL